MIIFAISIFSSNLEGNGGTIGRKQIKHPRRDEGPALGPGCGML